MRNNPFHTCGGQQNSRVIHAAVPNMDIDIEEKCRAIKMAKAFVCLQVTCQFGKYFCLFTRQYFAGLCANLIGKSVQHAFLGRGVTSIVGLFRLEEFT